MKVMFNGSKKKAEYAEAAKEIRDEAEVADIEVFGVMWQVRDKDRARIQETIATAETLGAPPETTVNWILADNTTRLTTAAELKEVIAQHSLRRQGIFITYTMWRSSGMRKPFTLN